MDTPLTTESQNAPEEMTIEQFCAGVARTFKVRSHEVALYALQRGMLRFLYPVELRFAGVIPLTSSAMVARTATTQRSEFYNSFASVRHSSVFETIKLAAAEGMDPSALTIQKMLSGAVFSPKGEVIGVIQVSRKGTSLASAGPDFGIEDLRALEQTAQAAGKLMPAFVASLANPK
jgi:hypothetical protein